MHIVREDMNLFIKSTDIFSPKDDTRVALNGTSMEVTFWCRCFFNLKHKCVNAKTAVVPFMSPM